MSTELKIGGRVQRLFNHLSDLELYLKEEINNLQNEAYCKEKFTHYYPILKDVTGFTEDQISEARKDRNNYDRYYARTYRLLGKDYLLSSQWYTRSDDKLDDWLLYFEDKVIPKL